jgi:uncharacterized membrane protein YhhN
MKAVGHFLLEHEGNYMVYGTNSFLMSMICLHLPKWARGQHTQPANDSLRVFPEDSGFLHITREAP